MLSKALYETHFGRVFNKRAADEFEPGLGPLAVLLTKQIGEIIDVGDEQNHVVCLEEVDRLSRGDELLIGPVPHHSLIDEAPFGVTSGDPTIESLIQLYALAECEGVAKDEDPLYRIVGEVISIGTEATRGSLDLPWITAPSASLDAQGRDRHPAQA